MFLLNIKFQDLIRLAIVYMSLKFRGDLGIWAVHLECIILDTVFKAIREVAHLRNNHVEKTPTLPWDSLKCWGQGD